VSSSAELSMRRLPIVAVLVATTACEQTTIITGPHAQRAVASVQSAAPTAAPDLKAIAILVDGERVPADKAPTYLQEIDPETIERVEVLKGPAARALFADAPGGVILITTKRAPRGR
jgi:outer membrane receptor protein involved in Fe transport